MRTSSKVLAMLFGATAFVWAGPDDRKAGPGADRGKPAGSGQARGGGEKGPGRGKPGPGGPQRRGQPRGGAAEMMTKLDANKDGSISLEEFTASEKMKNVPSEGQRRLFNHFDKNQDGKITRDELPRGEGKQRPRLDLNGDGKIPLDEFLQNPRFQKMPEEQRKELFKRIDRDGDGVLTPRDWEGRRPWDRDRRPPFLDGKALEELDADKDGALSFEEWKNHPRHKEAPGERLKEMFERMDRNKDGKLSPDDRPEGMRRGPGGNGPGGNGPGGNGPGGNGPGGNGPGGRRGPDGERPERPRQGPKPDAPQA